MDVTTRIVGAAPKQETILREILSGLGESVIEEIRVGPAGRDWTPYRQNSVVIHLRTAKSTEKGRAEWEAALVAKAFAARSRATRLQPVAAYETAVEGGALDGPGEPEPDHRVPVTRKEIDSGVMSGAKASGAEIVSLRIVKPRYLAAAVTLRVADPARFLKHRLLTFLEAVPDPSNSQYDGLYVLVTDRSGSFVWLTAMTVGETTSGGEHGARPDLIGCDPIPRIGGPIGADHDVPPCPID